MGMSQDSQDLPRPSYKELYKEGGEAGRERDGRTTLLQEFLAVFQKSLCSESYL